jgi:predicted GNAT superfamily acetyltransferase
MYAIVVYHFDGYVRPARTSPPVALLSDAARVNHDAPRRASATSAPVPLLDLEPTDIRIRPVSSLTEFRACVDLQAEVWGPEYTDSVPASLLQVATYVGGVVLGAFTTSDELVGFLFGLTGIDESEIVHWSHLLGVRDSARNLGVGRLLKEAQRTELAKRGVKRMSWTFDPLVAKNAYLNLNRLGARVVEYVPNMYGTTTSPLHYGIPTDRLIVSVDTHASPPVREAIEPAPVRQPVLSLEVQDGDVVLDVASPPEALWIEIPSDIRQVIEQSPNAGVAWREAVREHFQWALARGYEVTELQRDPVASRSFYLLRKVAA